MPRLCPVRARGTGGQLDSPLHSGSHAAPGGSPQEVRAEMSRGLCSGQGKDRGDPLSGSDGSFQLAWRRGLNLSDS